MRRRNVLSSELTSVLTAVGGKLERGDPLGAELNAALAQLGQLPPDQVARADGEIADAAKLYSRPDRRVLTDVWRSRPTHREQLRQSPQLAHLFLFHRDGYLREAALEELTGALPTAFFLAAVAWRLNDWVPAVRDAAARCAQRTFAATDPRIVARAATALLVRIPSWARWMNEGKLVDEALARPDVAQELAGLLARSDTGPLATILRFALRTPALDPHLEKISREAIQPSVRAVALETLLEARAKWPAGHAWVWIDKSHGLRKRVVAFEDRELTVKVAKDGLLAAGVRDLSAMVRRTALDGVIRHMQGKPEARALAVGLVGDKSRSVRERAEYILEAEAAVP